MDSIDKIDLELPFRLILLGGAERSGTTALHALLTTSPMANDWVPEAGMIQRLFGAWSEGWSSFEGYTGKHFFRNNAADYLMLFKNTVSPILMKIWENLDSPPVLILKVPAFSLYFQSLSEMTDSIECVATIRQPEDIIASQFRVFRKQKLNDNFANPNWIRRKARALLPFYDFQNTMAIVIRHEDFSGENISQQLGELLKIKSIDYKQLSDKAWLTPKSDDPWKSELYGKPIQPVKVDYAQIKVAQWTEIVDKETQHLKQRFGYEKIVLD